MTRASSEIGATGAVSTAVTAEGFRSAFRRHPGGVALITADPGDGPVALTATSVTSISAVPPLLLFSVSDLSSSASSILQSGSIVVHLLRAAELVLARLGATSGIDRFADASLWTRLPTGEPRFFVENWLRCRIVERITAGASTIVIAEVLETSVLAAHSAAPLVYHDREWHQLSNASRIAS